MHKKQNKYLKTSLIFDILDIVFIIDNTKLGKR